MVFVVVFFPGFGKGFSNGHKEGYITFIVYLFQLGLRVQGSGSYRIDSFQLGIPKILKLRSGVHDSGFKDFGARV